MVRCAVMRAPGFRGLWPTSWAHLPEMGDIRTACAFAPDFVLTPENYVDFRLPGLKVQLFHGVGVEKASHYVLRHFFDIYCTSGPIVTQRFEKLAAKHGYFQVVETGWPKFDHILSMDQGRVEQHRRKLDGKRIILYAPTFSRRMQSASELADHLPNILRPDEVLLVKFHELMPRALVRIFENMPAQQVMIMHDQDITPYLHLADLLISDTSSVIYEFLCLDKPVITFKTQGNTDKALNILSPDALRPALDLLTDHPDFGLDARRAALHIVNPRLDGRIAEHIILALEAIAEKGFEPLDKKPPNLIRKSRLLYQYYLGKMKKNK
jgi:CDP-glycerol glycerophosphotransferase (TagB/SpsB family)